MRALLRWFAWGSVLIGLGMAAMADSVTGVQVPLNAGWNAVGFQAQRLTSLTAPQVAGTADWNGTQYVLAPLTGEGVNGRRGYWVFASAPTTLTYSGLDDGQGRFVDLTLNGYQLISFATSVDIPVAHITATQNSQSVALTSVVGALFEIGPTNQYTAVNLATGMVRPGRAYWVFASTANGPVRLNLPDSGPLPSPVPSPVNATAVALSPLNASVAVLTTRSFTLQATLVGGGTQDVTASATWESSQPSIASLLEPGVFKGLNTGTTVVTARYGALSASTNLTVTDTSGPPAPTPVPTPVPAFFVLGSTNTLSELNPADGAVRSGGAITGLGTDSARGIALRPATGGLFLLGFNFASVGTEGALYTVEPSTRVATQVGARFPMPNSIGSTLNAATAFGLSFNPVVDRIRVVSTGRDNFRLNPITGAIAGADTLITPAGTLLAAAAYTNPVAGATSTTLYAIDTSTSPDQLVIIGGNPVPPGASPNGGVATVVGPLGAGLDSSSEAGLAIDSSGVASATLTVGGVSSLYSINLATGAATLRYALPGGLIGRGLEAR